MNCIITIVQFKPKGETYIKLIDHVTGETCTEAQYEEFLTRIGAECLHRF